MSNIKSGNKRFRRLEKKHVSGGHHSVKVNERPTGQKSSYNIKNSKKALAKTIYKKDYEEVPFEVTTDISTENNIINTSEGADSKAGIIVAVAILIFLFLLASRACSKTPSKTPSQTGSVGIESTVEQSTEIEEISYIDDCVVDELNWLESISDTRNKLRNFFEMTEVQPYVVLKAYDRELKNDAQKRAWAENYFNDANLGENTFLFVYFDDGSQDVGYMCYVLGEDAQKIMGEDEIDLFWKNIDYYWYSELSTDEVIVRSFNETGSAIFEAK